jgi:predicted DNA-binding protein (MmcQ/YjbR family)
MDYKQFNAFCKSLPSTTYVMQWGESHVWKVGGKVFAIGGWAVDEESYTFKVDDFSFEMLGDLPGLRPAPYLASRGLKWIQHYAQPGLDDARIKSYIKRSHLIVSQGLSKKKQRELGLID